MKLLSAKDFKTPTDKRTVYLETQIVNEILKPMVWRTVFNYLDGFALSFKSKKSNNNKKCISLDWGRHRWTTIDTTITCDKGLGVYNKDETYSFIVLRMLDTKFSAHCKRDKVERMRAPYLLTRTEAHSLIYFSLNAFHDLRIAVSTFFRRSKLYRSNVFLFAATIFYRGIIVKKRKTIFRESLDKRVLCSTGDECLMSFTET